MRKYLYLLVSVLVIVLDQTSKWWMLHHLTLYHPQAIWPMLNLTLAFNTGSAFSFLSHAGAWHHWFFVIFSVGMSIFLLIWIYRLPVHARVQLINISLILGGALGNLIDRLRYGYVIDFIDLRFFPSFNYADLFTTLGVCLWIYRLEFMHLQE